jgi:hypothetical protein
MRAALVAIGLFLVASGILGIMYPRAIVIPHPRFYARGWGRGTAGAMELVSQQGCVVYGALSVGLGIAAFWSASVRGPDVPRADRSIAQSILAVRRGLEERYGRMGDCTVAQIEKTASDLRVPKKIVPYLCAAFLGRAELESLRENMPGVAWDEVEGRIERITFELPYGELSGAHFHESWRPGD